MTFVIDTSAATKLFIDEAGWWNVRSFVSSAQMIAAPALFKIELTSACVAQWRLRGLEKLRIGQNIALISAFLDPKNMILYADEDDFEEAVALAISYEHRIADCHFVALARRLEMALLTADMKQAQIAIQEGIEVTLIETR
ncbi:type II toxin-antitoxin system VapC family toxin [Candidatus Phycosocius spiralis]|uniref:PIN domain-containing protein n=1 Tax=Candidatus Phycosocius spiralis TaxID=2815099 RepID=A0ABQ4PT22_9PROT|nr:type II toxin-antitoxin system VapC family toxin [Candidatus Phycosocius spiralis]GIU66146.1 hypothetical protein PsB1_0300 [Candidatus Phycosocius spiralis]